MFFGSSKNSPDEYTKAKTADSMVDFVFSKLKVITRERLGRKKETVKPNPYEADEDDDVIILNSNNFDSLVLNSKYLWFVNFHMPGCHYCKLLDPHWKLAAKAMKGKVKFASLNAKEHKSIDSRFTSEGYPTIKIFAPRSDSGEDYLGPREADYIIDSANKKIYELNVKPELDQLTSEEALSAFCRGKQKICVIAILPHIFETTVQERVKQISTVIEASYMNKSEAIQYLWAQGGDFFDLEEKLGITFGTPALVAISFPKKKFVVMRSSYSKDNLALFVSRLISGKHVLENLPASLPQLATVDEWDGKDSKPEIEEL